ncbi:MAG: NADH:flavin oxidoreductase [Planctomycetota bacterium]
MFSGLDILFSPMSLRHVTIPNRLIRSATFEGCGDRDGFPRPALGDIYTALAHGGIGAIITGFTFISKAGRAMQPGQCGIDSDEKIPHWNRILRPVREANPNVRLFMQIAHTGRQTRSEVTGLPAVGVSGRKCTYFRQQVETLDDAGIAGIVREFGEAAFRAKEAGFDGVQVHGAHGYLVHQFLSGWTNHRTDRWKDRPLFLLEVIRSIRARCGEAFPVLVKLSAADDDRPGIGLEDTLRTVRRLEDLGVDALEISYGTMERALNIIRGAVPVDAILEVNPFFNGIPRCLKPLWKRIFIPVRAKRFIPFRENYNVENAARIKERTTLPVFPVGGIRNGKGMVECVETRGLDAVGLSRPLVAEPDLPNRLREGGWTRSLCSNCNLCTVYCDSPQTLRCHLAKEVSHDHADRREETFRGFRVQGRNGGSL